MSGAKEVDKGQSVEPSDEVKTAVDKEQQDYLEQLRRLQAEFMNYRKRVEKERESLFLYAKSDLVAKLLPVLDDLERFMDHHKDDCQGQLKGLELIVQNYQKVLTDEGLKEVPSTGEQFDPQVHEAVGVDDVGPEDDGKVIETWQKGFWFGERLIRPGRVKVGKHRPESDKTGQGS